MTSQELETVVQDVIAFLQALDALLPSKIDEELVAFLQSLNSNPWLYDLLLTAINTVQKKPAPQVRKF